MVDIRNMHTCLGQPGPGVLDVVCTQCAWRYVLTYGRPYAAPEFQVGFNAADADGASWRQYVPMAIWSDEDWFDDAGNYLGRSGGPDTRKTTVTRR